MKIKWMLVTIILVPLVAVVLDGAGDFLSLEYFKQQRADFHTMYTESPTLVILVYFLIYLLVATFSIPGAAVLTIGSGALFGFFVGTLISSFASSIGALLAFWVFRLLARDVTQKKFSRQLTIVRKGIQEDGVLYLLGLRLVPVFPFFLVNILIALTSMRSWTFYLVSQIGMLAGTMVYVNAGLRLADIDSLSGIIEPQLLFAFILLAIFPILVKKVIRSLKRRI
jgi:uncharacterized membrane protein YdjX (TVP38/TMEM64 family)